MKRLFSDRMFGRNLLRLFSNGYVDIDYLIHSGVLQNATFTRATPVVLNTDVFGIDVPPKIDDTYISHGEVTAVSPAYDISPIVRPTDPDIVAAPSATWDLTNANNTWVTELLSSDGILTLANFTIFPTLAEIETGVTLNIISNVLRVNVTTGLLELVDALGNVASSASPYVAGSSHNVIALFTADGRMRLDVDGVLGTDVAYSGSFNVGTTLTYSLNSDVISVSSIYGSKGLNKLALNPITIDGNYITIDGNRIYI